MTPQIMNDVRKDELRILESEQMSVSVLVEITKFLERTSVQYVINIGRIFSVYIA